VTFAELLVLVQVVIALIALFLLADGVEWVREHIRAIGLSTVLVGGSAASASVVPATLAEGAVTVWTFIGLMMAACAAAGLLITRDLWDWHFRRRRPSAHVRAAEEDEWLVYNDGIELGPFTSAELTERLANGEFSPSVHVWKPGMDKWRPAYAAGLQRIAGWQVGAVPLSDARNKPRNRGGRCPPSIGVVPPWMARSWTQYHPERTRAVGT
jgi:hypothetical protein